MSGSQNIYKSVHEHGSSGGAVALVVCYVTQRDESNRTSLPYTGMRHGAHG